MKKTFLFLFVSGAVLAAALGLEARLEKTHAQATDPQTVLKLRDKMTDMETRFLELQILIKSSHVDFDKVGVALTEFQRTAEGIQKVNPEKALDKPLQDLAGQISGLQKYVKRQDPISLRSGIDGLYDSCFKCHSTHAPLM